MIIDIIQSKHAVWHRRRPRHRKDGWHGQTQQQDRSDHGTSGIGAATATCFQAEGARVIVTGSDPTTLQVAREKMPGIEVIASEACDVAATKRLVET